MPRTTNHHYLKIFFCWRSSHSKWHWRCKKICASDVGAAACMSGHRGQRILTGSCTIRISCCWAMGKHAPKECQCHLFDFCCFSYDNITACFRAVSHWRELFARTIRANVRVVVLAWVFTLSRTRMFARIVRANSSHRSLCQMQFAQTTCELS